MSSSDQDTKNHAICTLRWLGIVLTSCIVILLILKVCHVGLQPVEVSVGKLSDIEKGSIKLPGKWIFYDYVGYGVFRRIDDIEFWLLVSWLISCEFLIDAASKLHHVRIRNQIKINSVVRSSMIVGGVLVLVYLGAYIYSVKATGGTFFWKPHTEWGANGGYVKGLQFFEGLVMCAGLVSASILLATAYQLVSVACQVAETKHRHVLRAISSITTAAAVPLIAPTLLFFVIDFAVSSGSYSETDKIWSPSSAISAIGKVVVQGLPFFALYFWCRWKIQHLCRFEHGVIVRFTQSISSRASWW